MTLRDDIRDGFDRQQARLGEVGDARHRLIQSGLAARDSASHRLQWAAGIAAVLIAALVIGTFAWVRSTFRPSVPAVTPRANASPTPLRNAVNVPDSTPLILYHDAEDFDQLDGMTWDGKVAGRIGAGALNGAWANSAGSLYASLPGIWDRHGHVVNDLAGFTGKSFVGTWADDQVHYCGMAASRTPAQGVPAILEVAIPGQAPRQVAQIATIHTEVVTNVAACSFQYDRAVVVQSAGQGVGTAQYWVVQLSTGKILWSHQFQETAGRLQIAASRDGQLVAEAAAGSGGAWTSTIFGPDGKRITQVDGYVEGFSWDGSLAVVGAYGSPASVMRWRDGTVLWSCPPGVTFSSSSPEPGGSRLAVATANPVYANSVPGVDNVDLYIVSGDGVARVVVENLVVALQ